METYHGEFDGEIILNDQLISSRVSVFLSENEISISGLGSREVEEKKLSILPFNKHMIMSQSPEMIATGFEYQISGTRIGGFHDGRVAPESRMDSRPVQGVHIKVNYTQQGIAVSITGVTLEGNADGEAGQRLEPWKFEVKFFISLKQIQSFFKLKDSTFEYFSSKISECAPDA